MNEVQPIRDPKTVQQFYKIAHEHDRTRKKGETCWELLMVMGFSTALRISDLVRLKVKDLRGKKYVRIKAKKTGKPFKMPLNAETQYIINRLLEGRNGEEYALQSWQKDRYTGQSKGISRQAAYKIINGVAREIGMHEKIGTHTLRKTFGYHYYKREKDIAKLKKILQHTNERETLGYIGIIDADIEESLSKFTGLLPKQGRR